MKEMGRRLDVADLTDPNSPEILETETRMPSKAKIYRKFDQLLIWEQAKEEAEWLRVVGRNGRIYRKLCDGSFRDLTNTDDIEGLME